MNQEDTTAGIIVEESKCSNCTQLVKKDETFCGNCGFPENGSEQEKSKFNYSKKLKKNVVDDAKNKLKSVKILLYIMAGINFFYGVYYLSQDSFMAEAIASFFATIIFIGCAIWVDKSPLVAVLSAFGFWLLIQILSAILEPTTLFQGLIIKIIFISIFIKGIKSAKDYKDFTAKLNQV